MNTTLAPTESTVKINGSTVGAGRGASPSPNPASNLNREGKRIQELMEQVSAIPEARVRDLVHECLQSVLALHGDGLARILQLIKNAGVAGQEVNAALLRDKLVTGMLLIHGLHPVPLEARLREALGKVRPYMQSHGGNVELIHFENDTARLRLEGTCHECPSSAVTLELAVRQAIEEACPDLLGFEVDGMAASTTPNHLPANAPKWTIIEEFAPLRDGETRVREVSGVPLLFVKAGGVLYVYRNHCPACGTSLDAAELESTTLSCALGHRFNVQRAGICPDNPELHLEPFPLLATNGSVKISVR